MQNWSRLLRCRTGASLKMLNLRKVVTCCYSNKTSVFSGSYFLINKPVYYLPKAYLSKDDNSVDKPSIESHRTSNGETSQQPIGNISPRLAISFTCKVCGHRSEHKTMSKKAYMEGVVIITCDGCGNNHLIADNLEWFADKGKKINIEKLMEQKGENIKRGFLVEEPGDDGVKEVEII